MAGIVKLLTNVLTSTQNIQSANFSRISNNNPFASASSNPFVTAASSNPFADYGQNKPVAGGYFAGYYNNQPNIVGRRLFIEA